MKYDSAHTEAFYDNYGTREWGRFERTAAGRVNFHIHRHYLQKYVKAGDRVFEIGAGPGRFTIELAKMGANITVGDISKVQLELNKQIVIDAGLEKCVSNRIQCDIVDLSQFGDNSFDTTIAFGGPISYALEKAHDAFRELLRVTKRGGYALFSVMSKLGSMKNLFPAILELTDQIGFEAIENPWRTGFIGEHLSSTGHRFRLFLVSELHELLKYHACKVIEMSASNYLSSEMDTSLDGRWDDKEFWNKFLQIELEACSQQGALDGGTHIIAVVQKL